MRKTKHILEKTEFKYARVKLKNKKNPVVLFKLESRIKKS